MRCLLFGQVGWALNSMHEMLYEFIDKTKKQGNWAFGRKASDRNRFSVSRPANPSRRGL